MSDVVYSDYLFCLAALINQQGPYLLQTVLELCDRRSPPPWALLEKPNGVTQTGAGAMNCRCQSREGPALNAACTDAISFISSGEDAPRPAA